MQQIEVGASIHLTLDQLQLVNLSFRLTMTTDEMMALCGMLEKGTDADVLWEMMGFAAERLMELEVQAMTGAGPGERSLNRVAQRNGYCATIGKFHHMGYSESAGSSAISHSTQSAREPFFRWKLNAALRTPHKHDIGSDNDQEKIDQPG